MKFFGKISTFGGPDDTGVAHNEGLALIEPEDLEDWWFRHLFISTTDDDLGLARRLNPAAFYCAARWDYHASPRDLLRYAFLRITSQRSTRSVFARPVDWGPNVHTGRVLDLSPGVARALRLFTGDLAQAELLFLS